MAECDDLPLVIPVQSLSDHFICAVCMSQMKDSHLTPCGHRYCGDCIKECVNRRHKCPCCNNRIRVNDLIRDHQYDELVCLFNSEREKAEKKYFDILINKAAETNQEESPSSFSPVENVLKNHVKKSLVAHERYYQELKREHKQKLAQLDADHQRLIEEAKMQGLTDDGEILVIDIYDYILYL
ncbi:E3 ubiquitin-protein ligase COP1-like [Lingula anatina]|uniref:E3 ubiquitin-protein ligase COP1-like n=1 Tax=Lingula anatina TaxID=7574 RepID=A0A1S3KHF4_LINAN|nr:E3 ubiquitin-protein ligase COP1-like [Lingula anatina]|eukprot:XP_013422060.1 E3 ubiquitin-protein ligase COP1-like [Lingula anatina]